jgi:hypothetical protein
MSIHLPIKFNIFLITGRVPQDLQAVVWFNRRRRCWSYVGEPEGIGVIEHQSFNPFLSSQREKIPFTLTLKRLALLSVHFANKHHRAELLFLCACAHDNA